jgi:Acyl-CoA carboxylase epsilon subunit
MTPISIVRGRPDDDELAAVVAALAVAVKRGTAAARQAAGRSSRWRHELRAGPLQTGPDAWRRSTSTR